jgi:hypothetical protein
MHRLQSLKRDFIACLKRGVRIFRHCKEQSDEAIHLSDRWIASRSLSSGARSRDPLARNDDLTGNHAGSSYPIAVSISIVRRTAGRAIMRA